MSHGNAEITQTVNVCWRDLWLCLHSRPLVITTLSFSGVSQSRLRYVSFRHIRFGINKRLVFSACQQRMRLHQGLLWCKSATAKTTCTMFLKIVFVTSTEVKYAPPPSRFCYVLLQKVAFYTIHTVLAPNPILHPLIVDVFHWFLYFNRL